MQKLQQELNDKSKHMMRQDCNIEKYVYHYLPEIIIVHIAFFTKRSIENCKRHLVAPKKKKIKSAL